MDPFSSSLKIKINKAKYTLKKCFTLMKFVTRPDRGPDNDRSVEKKV